jgi:hypothetical protein
MLRMSGIIIMQTVPALLPVDARNTCREHIMSARAPKLKHAQELTSMNGNGHSEAITASMSVMQKH